ncbi:hypothetical protein AB0D84_21590 [Streptomyces sp. NPDC048193]|uniref:hypothetical protein n=1 Tax=unclassified Streptomyces TaxID=2593676 RepID=UPI00341D2EBA
MLKQLIDDNDELWRAVERLGSAPTSRSGRIDPDGNTTLRGDGDSARADRALRIAFSGVRSTIQLPECGDPNNLITDAS